ncbi:hypothetical protein LCGC14_2194940, partial [marine sediment metagenome]
MAHFEATLTDVKNERDRLQRLHARMDRDKDFMVLKKYQMLDVKNQPVTDVINVTLNTPALVAAHVQSALQSATQQMVVSGEGLGDDVTHPIELMVGAVYKAADRRLRAKREPTLRPFITQQLDMRGRAATRVTLRMTEAGIFVPDILPIDTRYFYYATDEDGFLWAAYQTLRSLSMIEATYPDVFSKITHPGNTITHLVVTDLWDRGTNRIYVGGSETQIGQANSQEVFAQDNIYKNVPFNMQMVELGMMFKDPDSTEHYGESIYFLARDLFDEDNRQASINQTLSMKSIKPGEEWVSDQGTRATLPKIPPSSIGARTTADKGGGTQIVPTGDMKDAGKAIGAKIDRSIQTGTLSQTDLGNAPVPVSGVAIIQLEEASGEVFLPRLAAKGLLYQDMSEMIIEQIQNLGVDEIKMGAKGHQQTYKVSDLEGEYDISYEYIVRTPQTDVARLSMADIASRWEDDDTIRRDRLKMTDPTDVKEKVAVDRAAVISEEIDMLRTARSLLS